MFVMGHGGNTVTRMPEAAKGLEKLDLLVVADPHPTTWAVLGGAQERHLPAADLHQLETRRLAHGVEPLDAVGRADRQADLRIEGRLRGHVPARQEARLRRPDVQEHQGREQRCRWPRTSCARSTAAAGRPAIAASRRSASRCTWRTRRTSTWSRCGPSDGPAKGDYYGLPWPCWGTPEFKHPGTPLLYNTNLHVKDGGGTFRARFGVEREEKLPDGTHAQGQPARRRLLLARTRRSRTAIRSSPTACSRSSAGTRISTEAELAVDRARSAATTPTRVSWAIDLSGGIQRVAHRARLHPLRQRQGARQCVRNLPDPIPVHREPIYTPRPDLVAKYPTLPDARAVPRAEYRLRRAEGGGRQGHRQAVPAHPHLRPAGRIRRRRRGDALQQVARRTAAGHVHRDQSRRMPPSAASRTAAGSGCTGAETQLEGAR